MHICEQVLPFLTGASGYLLCLAVMASGFVMMFKPEAAKQLLKNAAVALGIFVLGNLLLGYFCAAVRHAGR